MKDDPEASDHVEKTISLLGLADNGYLRPSDDDPPDFEFEYSNGRLVSIEHTRLFHREDDRGVSLQVEESERDIICSLAEQRIQEYDVPLVFVNVDFRDSYGLSRNESVALSKRKRGRIAHAICEIVAANIPREGERLLLPKSWDGTFPEELDHIHIWRSNVLSSTQIVADGGAAIPPLTTEMVSSVVQGKDERLRRYAATYAANWLVLVVERRGLSSDFDLDLSSEALSYEYQSGFDEILLLRNRAGELIRLQTRRPTA